MFFIIITAKNKINVIITENLIKIIIKNLVRIITEDLIKIDFFNVYINKV